MSEKPLSKQNRDELVATAEGLGLEVPEGATKKQIVTLIEAAPAPAPAAQDEQPAADTTPADEGQAQDPVPADRDAPVDSDAQAGLDPDAEPVDQDVSELDDGSGLITITRDITEFASNGDWVDPFSGLRVHHGSAACSQSGAVRQDDDTAVVRVTPERAAELGA